MAQVATMTKAETPEQKLARLEAENALLKQKIADRSNRALTLKVSAKGALSVYGMGRFPVTLYKEQWIKLFAASDDVKAFIAEHDKELKAKGE